MIKKLTPIVLVAALGLFGCSGSGPSSSGTPPVTPATWSITSITVSDASPYVESVVLLTITVEKDGAAAPDGTNVDLSVSPSANLPEEAVWGFGNGQTTAKLATSSGEVSITFYSDTAATFVFGAQVRTTSGSASVQYRNRDITDALQIYAVAPRIGAYDGGEQVTMTGKGIVAPIDVVFSVAGTDYPAVIEEVNDSVPPSAEGYIIVRTPYISNLTEEQREDDRPADIEVTAGAGTQSPQAVTLTAGFTFQGEPAPPDPEALLQEPRLYMVSPDFGGSQGGEVVTLLGRNFRAQIDDGFGNIVDMPAAVDSVTFNSLEAQIQSISPDGTQITVITPQFIVGPLEEDLRVDVAVTTSFDDGLGTVFGPFTATLINGFVVKADNPQPEISSIAPIAGPIDGGTRVTIFGSGFQAPMQVFFGGLAAIDVEVNDDQTLADNDTIICTTPDYSQQPDSLPPLTVDVLVRNAESGKEATFTGFTYGDSLYISGNDPQEGGPGTLVLIYGSGFEDPLDVEFVGANVDMEVLSVSGTELAVRFPLDEPVACTEVRSNFLVTLDESGTFTQGGDFTYLGNTPLVYSVDPVFIQEIGNSVVPNEITVFGEFFLPDLLVEINGYRMDNVDIEVVDTKTINVVNLPSPDDIGLSWDTVSCVTDQGLTGTRLGPTPVTLSVINIPGECRTELPGALVYEPEDDTCQVAPAIAVIPPVFGPVEAPTAPGTCGMGTLTINNSGSGTLDITNITLLGQFFFNNSPGGSQNLPGPITIQPFGTDSWDVYFCPDIDNGQLYSGQVVVVSNDPGSPTVAALNGQEGFPVLSGAANYDFSDQTAGAGPYTQQYTLTNTGTATLDWSASIEGNPQFALSGSTSGSVAPGDSVPIDIDFSPDAVSSFSATLTIDSSNADAQGAPLVVAVTGNGV
jgi:hypothetical protein